MKPTLPEPHLEAWRKFYVSFWRITAVIENDLAAAGRPSLSWYDVLYQLYLAPERRLRMSHLARTALLSRSGLTRLVDRLVAEKLIERVNCESDRRVQYAQLTPAGLAALRDMWPFYREGIARCFAAHLSEAEAKLLTGIFGRMADALEPSDSDGKAR